MSVKLGPVLSFRGATQGSWNVSALCVTDDAVAPVLVITTEGVPQAPIAAVALMTNRGRTAWRAELSVPRGQNAVIASYVYAGESGKFTVPGTQEHLRIGYASCNGFSHPKYMDRYLKKRIAFDERWLDMRKRHEAEPHHLLLLGGDQIYGDSIWDKITELGRWRSKGGSAKKKLTAALKDQIEAFYFDLYCERWKGEAARMLGSVPCLMMWDDHDIFDGWGSYPEELHKCEISQGIFKAARDAFAVFQQQVGPGGLPPGNIGTAGFSYRHRIDHVVIFALDLRSERTEHQILEPQSWTDALQAIDAAMTGAPAHLLLMSSIPVVYPRLGFVENLLEFIPGEQELEDDLRDHWTSKPHRKERVRLVQRLLDASARSRCRVTVLSGDVHVAALGVIESTRDPGAPRNSNVINQLISSAVVHAPPPGIAAVALKAISGDPDPIQRDVAARMIPFSGDKIRFVAKRNWMRLLAERTDPVTGRPGRIRAEWFAEDDPFAYDKVIHPVE